MRSNRRRCREWASCRTRPARVQSGTSRSRRNYAILATPTRSSSEASEPHRIARGYRADMVGLRWRAATREDPENRDLVGRDALAGGKGLRAFARGLRDLGWVEG